jgi:hypothetical protein
MSYLQIEMPLWLRVALIIVVLLAILFFYLRVTSDEY